MASEFVYVAAVWRPGLADPKTFAFLDKGERDAFVVAAKEKKWYRVESYQIALHEYLDAMAALKDAFGV